MVAGTRVSCPPNEHGLEDLALIDTEESKKMMKRRIGIVEYIPKHRRFLCVRMFSISGKPTYVESCDENTLTKI